MNPAISNILDRLTDAQRKALLRATVKDSFIPGLGSHGEYYGGDLPPGTAEALDALGLTETPIATDPRGAVTFHINWKPLGLRVRAALRASEGNLS